VSLTNNNGETALQIAARMGHLDSLKYLIYSKQPSKLESYTNCHSKCQEFFIAVNQFCDETKNQVKNSNTMAKRLNDSKFLEWSMKFKLLT